MTDSVTQLTPRAKLALALSKAQAEYLPLKKSKQAKIKMKNGGEYEYFYADLSDMFDSTRAALSKHGLAVTQLILGNELESRLMHESGEELVARSPLPTGLSAQEYGSAITYLRRYALGPILGIASEDDDGGAAQAGGSKVNPTAARAAAKPAQKPDSKFISQDQIKRLFTVARACRWKNDDLRSYLKKNYNLESTKLISKTAYPELIAHLEQNPMPAARDHLAGMENFNTDTGEFDDTFSPSGEAS